MMMYLQDVHRVEDGIKRIGASELSEIYVYVWSLKWKKHTNW